MNNLYKELHNLYPVQKTLRFELKPIGKTKENIEKEGILHKDEHRAEIYKKVKKYCDEYHKTFIDKVLEKIELPDLDKYLKIYNIENKDEKQKKDFYDISDKLRKIISDSFKKDEEYKGLFQKDMINSYLKVMYKDDKEKLSDISEFDRFTTYFSGYNKNRENMYVAAEESTSIAYRIINENLPTFISNMKTYKKAIEKIPEIEETIYKELEEYIQTNLLSDMFSIEYFNDVLTQKGIEIYNIIISGKSLDNKKIKGLNEYINEYNQKNKEKLPKLKELYKQILSDKMTISFKFDELKDDQQLLELINEYYMNFIKIINVNSKDNLISLMENINKYDLSKVYINNDISITNISQEIFGEWSYIQDSIKYDYDINYNGKKNKETEQYIEERKNNIKKNSVFSIKYIQECINKQRNQSTADVVDYFRNYIENNKIIDQIENKYNEFKFIYNIEYMENSRKLISDEKSILHIKELLDAMKNLQNFIKILIPKDKTIEKDENFYSELNEYYEVLSNVIPVYNKARNYLTQKPYSTNKIKLNFENPILLEGWDLNKEKADYGIIFMKDSNYYLGIINPRYKNIFDIECKNKNENKNYRKMEYKLLPGPNKMLPKVFFSNSRIDEFKPSDELLKNYSEGRHKKGEKFDIVFCHELIDFFKKSISLHEDWKNFDFNFSDTRTYEDISQFYNEVEKQGYKIQFKEYDEDYINELVEEGKLYLFQIYNKDFSKYSHGKKNLHTLYWEELFTPENLNNPVYKLNGGAEIFYRKASLSIEETAKHEANKPINNKNPETIKKGKTTSTFDYTLIKNKRFTLDKFQFHVPITMNFKNSGISNINSIVNKCLKYYDDIHVIRNRQGREKSNIYKCN